MRKFCCFMLLMVLFANMFVFSATEQQAQYSDTKFAYKSVELPHALSDADRTTYTTVKSEATITLERADGIAHLYIEFDRVPSGWSLIVDDQTIPCGKEKFLHDYVNLISLFGKAPTKIELKFPDNTVIADIYGFSSGSLPNFVQIWSAPCQKADLLLISSHSDDEQLFFAGVLPYYAIERNLNVQVAYMVQHFELDGKQDHFRPHEQLDGLWAVGVKNYPVMSDFPDVYSESKNRDTAFKMAQENFKPYGVSYDDFKEYTTELLRRFKPLVVVSHDLSGEYGHGTHVFCAKALTDAVDLAQNSENYPESAKQYGVWQVKKVYLHLYDINKITLDWDKPLKSLGGKTPFQKSQEGFACHESQHKTWFYRWLYGNSNQINKASQIEKYSPCEYGLYYTAVGLDVVGGDFMENVTTYAEQERQESITNVKEQTVKKENNTHAKPKTMFFVCLICLIIITLSILIGVIIVLRRRR